jgi:hypothetical protein
MIKLFFLVIFNLFAASRVGSGQNTKQNDALEHKIRKLEEAEVDALLRIDLAAMQQL